MGGGTWTARAFDDYTKVSKNMDAMYFASADTLNVQDVYKNHKLSSVLNPHNIMRECRDSEEHPNTLPVILALDVTGSMGSASTCVAQKLNEIMTTLYADNSIPDIEFCVMGIGDLYCDRAPIQMSQFESDVRIAEQLDEIYFEAGGGGNTYESYTAAWYMGLHHCDLDCWKRGQKGIIITMGDELPNPYLPIAGRHGGLNGVTGDKNQENVDTPTLIQLASQKYDIYHISVDDKSSSYRWHNECYQLDTRWKELLGDNYSVATLDNLAMTITNIIKNRNTNTNSESVSW